jgi:hypothetical protein
MLLGDIFPEEWPDLAPVFILLNIVAGWLLLAIARLLIELLDYWRRKRKSTQ